MKGIITHRIGNDYLVRLSKVQIRALIAKGHKIFVAQNRVGRYGKTAIRSLADETTANNLAKLPKVKR